MPRLRPPTHAPAAAPNAAPNAAVYAPPADARIVVVEHRVEVGAFLLGLGLGAAAALLLAPRTGEDTRRDLSQRAHDAGGAARRRAQGLVGDVSAGVSGGFDRARTAVELKRQQVQRAVEAGRVAAAQAREDLERRIAATKAAYQASAGVAPAGFEASDDHGLEG